MQNKIRAKLIIISFFFNIFFITNVFSETINKFNIKGNSRVSDETVIMFSSLEIGDNINQNILNNSLKKLYYTNYFKDVKISSLNGIVTISVKENPIIQKVVISGIDQNNIYEKISDVTLKIEKYPFVESTINEQVKLLKNILKSYGYYFVELETSIIKNPNNTIDLNYNFKLGEIAKIKKIKFIGEKIFSDTTLRNVIISEESKFWKFITRNKFLDTNRIDADIFRLNEFYKNRGYFNVTIKSTSAIINDRNQFELLFNIDAGNKFYFNNIKFSNNNILNIDNFKDFEEKIVDLQGSVYSKKKINKIINEFNNFTLRNNYIFLNTSYKEIIIDNNKIDISINFNDLDKHFVDRINILGNFITDEKVIRNELIVDEGDPFNKILFEKSIANMKGQNIFKTVTYNVTEIDNENKVIDIEVEEKPTGEIFAGAGTGTTGSSLTGGIKENNYLGLGIKLDTNFTITDDSIKGKFSVLNPNYNNSDKSIETIIESSTEDLLTESGYKTNRTGLSLGTEFEQFNDLFVNLEISNYYEDLETSNNANSIVKKQEGTYFENLISYALKFNKLDQNFQPTDGYINYFSQTIPVISDDNSIENTFTSSTYHSFGESLILSAQFYLSAINSIDDNVRISKRVYVPSRRLRGFESGKIGPKDGSQYIGGNYASALNLNSTLPNILFESEDVDINLFIDMANVWEVDYNSSLDSNKIRSSSGLALNWYSPLGPLSLSYAIPLSEAKTDVTENFRFQIGTSF